jgi:FKBP-type peptidyl-prolyl cis-trans isomerase 2
VHVKVTKIKDGLIYFDHNHELAGHDLDYSGSGATPTRNW